jgi:F-type H+-transporting ATPase subunit gamma
MKLVSAAKLNKAQQAILSSRPYARELDKTIKTASTLVENYTHNFLSAREGNRVAVLVVSSDKGLCGSYNSQVAKAVRNFARKHEGEAKYYFIGKKAWELLESEVNTAKRFKFKKSEPSVNEIREVASELSNLFSVGEYDKIYVCYNLFKSAISFETNVRQLLPFVLGQEEKAEVVSAFPFDFKYEPSPSEILDEVIPESYFTTLYTSILDAIASEHGSRMASMDSASKNCKDAIRKQTLKMNKLRQAKITTELIEVVSGAESLKG